MKTPQQKRLKEGWIPTTILSSSLQYGVKSPWGNSCLSSHLPWSLRTWQGDTQHTSSLVFTDISLSSNIKWSGSITYDNHLSLVEKHMVKLTNPWWSHSSLSQADFATYPCSTKSSTDAVILWEQETLLQSQRHPSISIMSTSPLNFSALMHPAPGDVVPCSAVLTFLGKPQPTPKPPSLRAWLCAAARRQEAVGSTSGRNCQRNVLSATTCTEVPSTSLAREPASTAANPNGLQEPPLHSSCTGYFLLNQDLDIFSQRKACLNSHTHRKGGKEGLSAYRPKFVNC